MIDPACVLSSVSRVSSELLTTWWEIDKYSNSLHDMKSVQDMGNSGSDKDINCVFEDILMAEDWWVSTIIAVD